MKTHLLFLLAMLAILAYWNNNTEKTNAGAEISMLLFQDSELVGHWLKTAGGEDANKNRILEDAEIIKNPEPGAYDNFHFYPGGKKYALFGMGIENKGNFVVKTFKGKKMIYAYTEDNPANLPEDEKDKHALKFEIVSLEKNKLVLIPPVYSFMLIVYTKT